MQMVSYWKNVKQIYEDDGLFLIIGWYDHKNQENGGKKALGVHWGDYPQSHNVLSPCVIPETTRDSILSGLLHHAVIAGEKSTIESIMQAIEFFPRMTKGSKSLQATRDGGFSSASRFTSFGPACLSSGR